MKCGLLHSNSLDVAVLFVKKSSVSADGINAKSIDIDFRREVELMKRVKAACICQNLHFMLKEDAEHDYAVKMVQTEVENYKNKLNKNGVKYRILSEEVQEDGSIMIEIKKQYNTSPVGNYLD